MLPKSQVRWSTMATILASIAVAALLGFVVVTLRSALLWLFISFFLAVVLNPLVDRLSRRMPRTLAVTLVLTAAVGALVGIGLIAVPPFIEQMRELATNAPAAIQQLSERPGMQQLEQRYHVLTAVNRALATLPAHLASAAQPLLAIVGGVFRLGVATISIFFVVLFMLLGGRQSLAAGLGLLEPRARARVEALGRTIYDATTRYALGTAFLALLAGVVASVTLAIAKVPYFLPLGVAMVFLDLIPFAGFVTGGLLITLVTGATVGWVPALVVLAVFVTYQAFESHLLLPIVHHKTVRVSALGIVVALLIGYELAGILGVLFAVPVVGALRIIVREVLAHHEAHQREREAAGEPIAPPPSPSGSRGQVESERGAPH